MIGAAIVGLGRWGQSFVRSVQGKSADIQFVAATTRTLDKARDFCAQHNVPLIASYEAILADRSIDAVVLATPHSQHEAQVKQAAAAGKHILVEKPIALTRKSAEAAADAAKKAGVLLAVGFNRRFHPSICEVRKRVKSGQLGKLSAIVGQHTSGSGPFLPKGEWRASENESPAGALTAVGVHTIDQMIELAGEVATIHCVTGRHGISQADDTTSIMLRFKSGVTGLMFCSISTAPNLSITVYGTKGLAEVSHTQLNNFRFVPMPTQAPHGPVTAPPPELMEFPGIDMLNEELTQFARAIANKTPYPIPISEILHGMSVFDAIVESAKTGRIVEVM